MSGFKLREPMGTSYSVTPGDIINTKAALSQLGYYRVPEGLGIQPWTDDAMFDGIRAFQKDNGLQVDGYMRPEGPTENAINTSLAESSDDSSQGPGSNMPVIVPSNVAPNMPVIKDPFPMTSQGAYRDKDGNIILDGRNPKNGLPLPPIKGPYRIIPFGCAP